MLKIRSDTRELVALLGRSWEKEMRDPRRILEAVMRRHGCGAVEALLILRREQGERINAYLGALFVSACVDMVEERGHHD
jgi:hypothetical protein